jgi:glycosyltransferase involved in cell wall biosynthesis
MEECGQIQTLTLPPVNPLVSIILPARNADENIAAALDAIGQQQYTPYEVIIISDGSTDQTNEICQRYPYKLIVQEWQGTASAENAGVALARGQILYFTDADVVMPPRHAPRVVETLRNNPEAVGLSGCYSAETRTRISSPRIKTRCHRYVHRTNGPYTVNLFGANMPSGRRLPKVGGPDGEQKAIEDANSAFALVGAGYRILMLAISRSPSKKTLSVTC